MKRILFSTLAIVLGIAAIAQVSLPNEPLKYEARYHCGFIKIDAGEATLNFEIDGDKFMASMNGCSVSIGGHCYAISDTLCANMIPVAGELSREIVTYENGWYAKPKKMPSSGHLMFFDDPEKYRNIRGEGELDASDATMEAITISADMLAMFYYFQEMDFSSMQSGDIMTIAVNLPDGDIQQVQIVYNGTDNYESCATYNLSFTYSYHGVMTKYPVTAQIDQVTRLPLLLSADIKIGHIELVKKGY